MKNYDCIQDGATATRSRSIGEIGEKLAEQVLAINGFTSIENLNRRKSNYKYADLYAEKDGKRFVISVKARNRLTAKGKLNPSYNLIKGGNVEFAKLAEEAQNAQAAWMSITLEDVTFDAYFGLLSSLANPRAIPMTATAVDSYLCLAQGVPHGEDPINFKNRYKRISDAQSVEILQEAFVAI